ncbi:MULTISPECIES: MoaD/ThiS family protein [Nosocomiicoccus]|uniref:Molybdopterin synthase sulfur carrier subunit n=1 Tax=Nosocomiicoccus massiliensis TaxID=1232430 RepID=A0AAF0YM07_9STAP|nr:MULTISPECIES: MoaD/ThiS family protein [Nosocomiicoccus]MDK6863605.1 MoaD/ThiS family protein [Nosocomiicoccus ampullae]OFL48850.1 molybdopterin synthase sulfur carrier subunit [Nosocomiicoccus sp. HMSC067E10]OFO53605.1 molybdopterin synthase sulfur carrier subunit [Nosocomiicoccus sp. HMSC059G07]OFS61983.1 molybdopterin synthase sulfur carrier subunit [Nosocomiicoccus sp. HMSC09A07]WOS95934.1 MoaD/ThiS family protein [Nosocomiicoccus massiliensis]
MKIKIFASIKEKIGDDHIELPIHDAITVKELKERLYIDYPELDGEVFQVAVNESFERDESVIAPDDVVALIPPVSGG